MPRGGEPGARVVDLDRIPAMAVGRHRLRDLGIPGRQRLLGGVGEDDAEPERLLETVPLVDVHVVLRILSLEEECREEPGRAPADDGDLHPPASPAASFMQSRRLRPS